MNRYLEELLSSGTIVDRSGELRPLHSNTPRPQCQFLQDIIRRIDAARCLEIGCAYGISTIAICEAASERPGGSVCTIDPHQALHWENLGLLNIERAGFSQLLTLLEEQSQRALPRLASSGHKFDFAYVDTTKLFDAVLIDAFYIVSMLRIGGVIVFDDCNWPGVRKVVRFLCTWPHLEFYASFGPSPQGVLRTSGAALLARLPYANRFVRPEIIVTDAHLGIAAQCVALRKVSEDTRPWDWSKLP